MDTHAFDISVQPPGEIGALGQSLRGFIQSLLAVESVPDTLSADLIRLRETIDSIAVRVEQHARSDRLPQNRFNQSTGTRPYYVKGALIGEHNPLVPSVQIKHADGVTSGAVCFGAGYEGPPGCVHGGFVALLFDQILGHHNLAREIPAMTGTLTVRYLGPTPLLTELRFEVRTAEITERRVVNEASLTAEGKQVCKARGIFVLPQPGNYMGNMGKVLTGES